MCIKITGEVLMYTSVCFNGRNGIWRDFSSIYLAADPLKAFPRSIGFVRKHFQKMIWRNPNLEEAHKWGEYMEDRYVFTPWEGFRKESGSSYGMILYISLDA